jgi:hypothetical protein
MKARRVTTAIGKDEHGAEIHPLASMLIKLLDHLRASPVVLSNGKSYFYDAVDIRNQHDKYMDVPAPD